VLSQPMEDREALISCEGTFMEQMLSDEATHEEGEQEVRLSQDSVDGVIAQSDGLNTTRRVRSLKE